MTASNGFDGIGDQIPALQRIRHPKGTHGDTVGYARGAELVPYQSGFGYRFLDPLT